MTQLEYIKFWRENSNLSEEEFEKLNQIAIPCNCKMDGCFGWAMLTNEVDNIKNHVKLYL